MAKRPDLYSLLVAWQLIAAAFWLFGIVAAVLFAYPFSPGHQGNDAGLGDAFGMIVGTAFVIGCLALSIAAGIGLHRRRPWARSACIANAVVSLLIVPIGTISGILVLLYQRQPEVRAYLAADGRSAEEAE